MKLILQLFSIWLLFANTHPGPLVGYVLKCLNYCLQKLKGFSIITLKIFAILCGKSEKAGKFEMKER